MPNTPEAEAALELLDRLVGQWTTEATHPAMPGVLVQGSADVAWLEGRRFLVHRARSEHPDFPDSISILGFTGEDRVDPKAPKTAATPDTSQLNMHYYDSRGVSRVYAARIDDEAWRLERPAEGFSQRFTGTFADGFRTIRGQWRLSEDGKHWNDDLAITYRRRT